MKRKIGLLVLMVLLGGTAAVAQSGNSNGLSTGQTINGGIPEAPIGHRQPRATDVPNEKGLNSPNDPMNKEDAVLDKKIKNICRGC
jgi:hypothetical protein